MSHRTLISTHSPAGSLNASRCTLTISHSARTTPSACCSRGQGRRLHLGSPRGVPLSLLFGHLTSSVPPLCVSLPFQVPQGRCTHHHGNWGDDRGGGGEMGFSANSCLCCSRHPGIQGSSSVNVCESSRIPPHIKSFHLCGCAALLEHALPSAEEPVESSTVEGPLQ